jgi:hypothetical protein
MDGVVYKQPCSGRGRLRTEMETTTGGYVEWLVGLVGHCHEVKEEKITVACLSKMSKSHCWIWIFVNSRFECIEMPEGLRTAYSSKL